jgi:GAF domain-containing protein
MTHILIGICAGLGALVLLLFGLLVARRRTSASADERFGEVVESLNTRMDELARELQGALERAEEEGRRSHVFSQLAGSIDLDEVLSRTLEAAGGLDGADAALVLLPNPEDGKPLVATLGLSVEEAERHAITGPPDGRLARSITMSYTYPQVDREAGPEDTAIHAGLAVPMSGDGASIGYLTIFTREKDRTFDEDDVRELETLATHAGPAIENARRFREARQLADLDALTGLHNRRFFHETLAREVARAHRYDRRLALVLFDLDDFKEINDKIGHLAGDSVLAEAAGRMRSLPGRRRRVRGRAAGVVARRRRPAVPSDPERGVGAADRADREDLPVGRRRGAAARGRRGHVLRARRSRAVSGEGRWQRPRGRRQLLKAGQTHRV